jgi:hypothetical protein
MKSNSFVLGSVSNLIRAVKLLNHCHMYVARCFKGFTHLCLRLHISCLGMVSFESSCLATKVPENVLILNISKPFRYTDSLNIKIPFC